MEQTNRAGGCLTVTGRIPGQKGEAGTAEKKITVTRDGGLTFQSLSQIDWMATFCFPVWVEGRPWSPPALKGSDIEDYNAECLESLLDVFRIDHTAVQDRLGNNDGIVDIPKRLAEGALIYTDLYWRVVGYRDRRKAR